jgi:hypothetical protein
MTSKVQSHLVEKFLTEVEALLQDLTPELRADIVREVRENLEARADDPSAELLLPDSFQYANELRQAAGLQPISKRSGVVANALSEISRAAKSNSVVRALTKVLRPLKPLFWIAVGISAFGLLQRFILGDEGFIGIPSDLDQWLIWFAVIVTALWVGSVKLGRRWSRVRTTTMALALLPLAISFYGIAESTIQTFDQLRNGNLGARTTGLINDGTPVTNIFPYDTEGNLLENITLIDDLGRPLNSAAETLVTPITVVFQDGALEVQGYLAPSVDLGGNMQWNVYPLQGSKSPLGEDRFPVAPPTISD